MKKIKLSKELKKALKESKTIIKEIKAGKRKGYNNMNDLIKSLEN